MTAYRPTRRQAFADKMLSRMVRKGRGPGAIYLLSVPGRVSGQLETTPVVPVQRDGQLWLVAAFGDVDWVRNARAAGKVSLGRGDDSHEYAVSELGPADAVPVLREYLAMPTARYVRKHFGVTPQSADEAFAAEAPKHPVFALSAAP